MTSILTSTDELGRLEGAWNELCLAQARPNPMMSSEWLTAWWRAYGAREGSSLAVWVKEEEGRLVAALPLYRVEERGRAVYRIIGTAEEDAAEPGVCGDYLGPLVLPGREDVVPELAAELAALARRDGGELRLADLTEGDPGCEALAGGLRRAGLAWQRSAGSTCPFLPLPDDWDAFLASLSSNFRAQIRQSEREWKKLPDAAVRRVESEADVEPFWEALVALHQKRWAARGLTGLFASPRFTAFHREVVGGFLRRGWLAAAVLHGGGGPRAAVYSFRMGPTTYYYNGGTDPDAPTKLRPGLVLHAHMIRWAIERKDREYDFMRGEELYKARFTDRSRRLFRVDAGRWTPLRAARYLARDGQERWYRFRRFASAVKHGTWRQQPPTS